MPNHNAETLRKNRTFDLGFFVFGKDEKPQLEISTKNTFRSEINKGATLKQYKDNRVGEWYPFYKKN